VSHSKSYRVPQPFKGKVSGISSWNTTILEYLKHL
jgi:hypothetical protein